MQRGSNSSDRLEDEPHFSFPGVRHSWSSTHPAESAGPDLKLLCSTERLLKGPNYLQSKADEKANASQWNEVCACVPWVTFLGLRLREERPCSIWQQHFCRSLSGTSTLVLSLLDGKSYLLFKLPFSKGLPFSLVFLIDTSQWYSGSVWKTGVLHVIRKPAMWLFAWNNFWGSQHNQYWQSLFISQMDFYMIWVLILFYIV